MRRDTEGPNLSSFFFRPPTSAEETLTHSHRQPTVKCEKQDLRRRRSVNLDAFCPVPQGGLTAQKLSARGRGARTRACVCTTCLSVSILSHLVHHPDGLHRLSKTKQKKNTTHESVQSPLDRRNHCRHAHERSMMDIARLNINEHQIKGHQSAAVRTVGVPNNNNTRQIQHQHGWCLPLSDLRSCLLLRLHPAICPSTMIGPLSFFLVTQKRNHRRARFRSIAHALTCRCRRAGGTIAVPTKSIKPSFSELYSLVGKW